MMLVEGLVRLRNAAGDTAVVSLYGGQLLSWRTAAGGEQLYCSSQSATSQGRAIRGGVPVCFPQFAHCGQLIKHGFARTSVWQLAGEPVTGGDATVARTSIVLHDSVLSRAFWPHGFTLGLQLSFGAGWIELSLQVVNTGRTAFDFTAALHTYLAAADVRHVAVVGLAAVPYLDSLRHNTRTTETTPQLQVTGELDRVYLGTPRALELLQDGQPCLHIEQQGFADTVVWNPGPVKAAALGDMPAADWTSMLCIEAAQVESPVHLRSGDVWQGMQRLTQPLHQH